jgi:hypothetical protein
MQMTMQKEGPVKLRLNATISSISWTIVTALVGVLCRGRSGTGWGAKL